MEKIIIDSGSLDLHKTFPYRIAWFNDIHVGGQMALWPRNFVSDAGNPLLPNEGQLKLLEYFDDFIKNCNDNKVNILAIPGDLIAGQNLKELGKFMITASIEDQKRACVELIADFCERIPTITEVWMWVGTPYHTVKGTTIEQDIASDLRADYGINAKYMGEYSIIRLIYGEYEKRIFVTHPSSGAWMYPEAAMGRDMLIWQEGVATKKLPHVDMIVRAHKHFFTEVHKPHQRAIQLPCWQFFVPYDGALKNFARYQPDIGSVIMLFDEKLRATVWHFIYDNIIDPKRYITVYNPKDVEEICLSKKSPNEQI